MSYRIKLFFSVALLALVLFYDVAHSEAPRYGGSVGRYRTEHQGLSTGEEMAGAKLIVIYPRPTDVEMFEKFYHQEHVPKVIEKLTGRTKIVATKVLSSPEETEPFYRIVEIHFPSAAFIYVHQG